MITPPATIGMLGGGQLGRYALIAARIQGYRTIVVDPDPNAPAGKVADEHLVAPFDDAESIEYLGAQCAVVTTEFENPPAASLRRLAQLTTVAPNADAVAVCQDRRYEKRFLTKIGVPVGPFAIIETDEQQAAAQQELAFPVILKTARMGYDGKGQVTVDEPDDLLAAWEQLGRVACVAETRVPLHLEVSVILARRADGATQIFPLAENVHTNGILDLTVVPARVSPALAQKAVDIATTIATRLEYVGTLAVEMFVVGGQLLVNEMAPRPHNSGHWTLDSARTDQFEQQIRAITGQALGPATMRADANATAMVNVLGDMWANGAPLWERVLSAAEAHLHLYGKAEPRPGRKMGHITVTAGNADDAAAYARSLRTAATR